MVDAGGAGRRALRESFASLVGRTQGIDEVVFCGRTDRGIVREGLLRSGLPDDLATIDAILDDYVDRLPEALRSTPSFRTIDGVHAALEVAESVGLLGIGTGNVARGARHKLEPWGLLDRFSFGGYGCDAEAREELLRCGAERGAATLGVGVETCHVCVIGDTPLDVAAARAIGASCLAVATGQYRRAVLAACQPDQHVESLLDADALAYLRAPMRQGESR